MVSRLCTASLIISGSAPPAWPCSWAANASETLFLLFNPYPIRQTEILEYLSQIGFELLAFPISTTTEKSKPIFRSEPDFNLGIILSRGGSRFLAGWFQQFAGLLFEHLVQVEGPERVWFWLRTRGWTWAGAGFGPGQELIRP